MSDITKCDICKRELDLPFVTISRRWWFAYRVFAWDRYGPIQSRLDVCESCIKTVAKLSKGEG
jgi:hypothetical protein